MRKNRPFFLLVIFLLMAFFVFNNAPKIRALNTTTQVFPSHCLGGWENPQNAAGQSTLSPEAGIQEFNNENSAVLGENLIAQLFCGYFSVDDQTNKPLKASVNLLWKIKFPEIVPEIVPDIVIVPEAVPEATSETSTLEIVPETPAAEPELKPETVPEPEAVPDPTSFLGSIAFAQEISPTNPTPLSGFLELRYSLNGVVWHSPGFVDSSNWSSFKAELPVESWDDLRKLQIGFYSSLAVDSRPKIYLESLWLDVEYDQTPVEAVGSAVDTVTDVVQQVSEDVSTVAENIVEAVMEVSNNTIEITPLVETPPIETHPEAVTLPKPPPETIKQRVLLFSLNGLPVPTQKKLPWFSGEVLSEITAENEKMALEGFNTNVPIIKVAEDRSALRINGKCDNKYFVVLVYRKSSDYLDSPQSFVNNVAQSCEGGKASFELSSASNLADGNYYLLIGRQDDTTWAPASALIPIRIESTIEEKVLNN